MEISYFNFDELVKKAAFIRNDNRIPPWLSDIILELANSSSCFALEEDTERYVIEYIYPH